MVHHMHHTLRTPRPHPTPTDRNLHTSLLPSHLIRHLLQVGLFLLRGWVRFLEDSILLAMVVRRHLCHLSLLLALRPKLFSPLLLPPKDSNQ